ncbi:metallothionein [Methylonatrum kenyense]|nr:metallothionein [Methylonatrum kenyense]MCK8515573.1 metallothionein [Methylonatrum kenyense]
MNAATERVECACSDCVCTMPRDKAVERQGRLYCGESCARGHDNGAGCGHSGCGCAGK